MNVYNIYCNLDNYLNEAGISVSDFCKEMSVSRACYYDWIKGDKLPTIEKCYHARAILQCELKRNISIEELWERRF